MNKNLFRAALSLFMVIGSTTSVYAQWIKTNWPASSSFSKLYISQTRVFARTWDKVNGGCMFLTSDNGANWTQIGSADSSSDILSIAMLNNNIIAGTWNSFYRSTFGSTGWNAVTPAGVPADSAIWSITMITTTLYAGTMGAIYKSSDSGTTWTEVKSGIPVNARITSFVASGNAIFAGSDSSGIFITTNGGTSWTAINSGLTNRHIFQLAALGTKLFAVTLNGVFVSGNNGTNWAATSVSLMNINCLVVANNQLFAGTDSSGVYLSLDSGATWAWVSPEMPGGTRVWSLAASSDNLFAGTNSGVWRTALSINPVESPVLTVPTDGSTDVSTSPTLHYGAVSGAATYGVQVSTSSTFAATVSSQTGLSATSASVSGLADATTYFWRANATNAAGTSAWSSVWSFTTTSVQTIPLPVGWGMKSLNVQPLDSSMAAVFGTDTSFFLFVKNNSGNVYSPFLGITDLSSVHTGQGYQAYCSQADTIRAQGSRIDAATTAISLPIGWNMIAYFPQDSDVADHALSTIVSNLILAKDYLGNVYAPALGVNSMPRMKPGEGYKVAMSAASVLAYPTSGFLKQTDPGGPKQLLSLPQPNRYRVRLNTGNNATIMAKRVGIGGNAVPDSSEISAFDEQGNLIGSGMVIQGKTAFAVWGDDPMTKRVKDGLASDEKLTFKLWTGTQELPLDFISGSGTEARYAEDRILAGSFSVSAVALIKRFDLSPAYPNPFRGSVRIAFDVPMISGFSEHAITIEIYDLKGNIVAQLAKGKYKAGHYAVMWNGGRAGNEAPGSSVYIVRMRTDDFDKRLKVVKLRN